MSMTSDFRTCDIDAARQLIARLGKLHLDHAGATAAEDRAAARRDELLAEDLVEHATVQQLRAALLIATTPAATAAPVPVVPGPLDAAAVIGRDELVALAVAHGQACMSWATAPGEDGRRALHRTWRELQTAVDRLCAAAPAYELGGGRTA